MEGYFVLELMGGVLVMATFTVSVAQSCTRFPEARSMAHME